MAEPVAYVTTFRIKEGKFQDYQRFLAALLKGIEESEPRIIAIHTFANEDGTEMTSIQLHPDAESMDAHMQVLAKTMGQLAEELTDVFQFIELVRAEVFGAPGERASEMDKPLIEAGVPFTFKPRHVDGFTRSSPG